MNQYRIRRKHSLLALAVVTGLAGCMVGPTYQQPDVKTEAQFKGAQALGERSVAGAPVALDRWWEGFNDPALNQLVDTALRENLSLEQALARSAQSAAFARYADAQLLPSGQASADASRARQSLEDPVVATEHATLPGFERTGNLYGAGVSSLWEIDLSGGLRRSAQAARAEYEAAQADVAAAHIQVVANVTDTYLLIRLLQSRLSLATEQVSTQADIEQRVGTLYMRGLAPNVDLQQARSEFIATQAAVPALKARLSAARNKLDVLLGRQPGTDDPELDAMRTIPTAPSIEAAGGSAALLRRRPDLIVAERHLAASNERIGQALAEYYPKVSLSALLGTVTSQGAHLFDSDANQAAATLGLRWRLFDFGRVDAQVNASKGAYSEQLAIYRHSVLQATAEVEDSIASLIASESSARLLQAAENARSSARDAILQSYKRGNSSLIDALLTQSTLQLAQAQRLNATYASASSAVALYKALGGGWSAPPTPTP